MNEAEYTEAIAALRTAFSRADAIVVGAGAGLSTAAGFTYAGERFESLFADFIARYGFTDMYSAGFYAFPTLEEQWAYWSRHIWCNRYIPAPRTTYTKLRSLLAGRDFFVITTNVDHQFQRAGFPKDALFYTQGDYGLWQCSRPCHESTYDNYETVKRMIEAQGFKIVQDNTLALPADGALSMQVPSELVPHCPKCGEPMSMNLRADETFVEDNGWLEAAARYRRYLNVHEQGAVLYLELGVGANTPGIIKYPFWQRVNANPQATYICVNFGQAFAPAEIIERSVLVDADIDCVLDSLIQGGQP